MTTHPLSEKAPKAESRREEAISSLPKAEAKPMVSAAQNLRVIPEPSTLTGPQAKAAAMADYRLAYKALVARDPDAAAHYPNPDLPGRNFDAVTVLRRIRAEPGSVRTVGPGLFRS